MGNNTYDRGEAFQLLNKYVKTDNLIRHALTVEAVMRHFAGLYPEGDAEKWGIVGLLHDIDYELYPEQHCWKARELMSPEGWPEEIVRAVESHGYKLVNDIRPLSNMEKVLYATDELTGLVAATTLLRPSRSILDLEVSSVKKKWKQKGFAAGCNREVIQDGADMLGMELDKLIGETIAGMKTAAAEIGLTGNS